MGSNPYSEANLNLEGDMGTIKIWHTAKEIPNGKDRYIIKWKDRNSYKLALGKEYITSRLENPSGLSEIERWAYIKDFEATSEQFQQKQIDWEQRRYEIAKDMLRTIYIEDGKEKRSTDPGIEFEYQSLEGCASEAVRFADVLIEELKKQNHG